MGQRNQNMAAIVGLSGATGTAMGRRLADAGYAIALLGDQTAELLMQLRGPGIVLHSVEADLTDRGGFEAAIAKLKQHFGSIQHLICGIETPSQGEHAAENLLLDWTAQVERPLTRVLLVCQSGFPHIARAQGSFLFWLNGHVSVGPWCDAAHASLRAALKSFVKSAAREFASVGVRVNAIIGPPFGRPCTFKDDAVAAAARCAPEQVAAVADFLLSERASYVTGQTIDAGSQGGRMPCISSELSLC